MKKFPVKVLYLLAIILSASYLSCNNNILSNLEIHNLKCEYVNDPLIARADPRLSWELSSTENGKLQTSWRIIVSDDEETLNSDKGNFWNSGWVKSNETNGIEYRGSDLKSFSKYYWKVQVRDEDGNSSSWSEPACFITGSLNDNEWKASWIGSVPEKPLEYPLVYKHIGYLSSYTNNRNEEKWIYVDLGKITEVDEIVLYPAFNDILKIKDFYFPLSFRIETSTDGQTWRTYAAKTNFPAPKGNPVSIKNNPVNARFVKLVASDLKDYKTRIYDYEDLGNAANRHAFSLAEMEVMNKDRVLSGKCQVTCKDALIKVDREDGYDPEMLTDGIKNTPSKPIKRAIPPSPLIRKVAVLKEKPVRALAFASALGVYQMEVNGQRPDSRVLAPEWTDYNKRVQYQAYDVTSLLNRGENVISAELADGWYAGMLGPTRWSEYFPKRGAYGLNRRFFFQMELTYGDGSKETIVTDGSWKIFTDGPVRIADNFLGESYDGRKTIEGWQSAGFDESAWDDVTVDSSVKVNLVPQTSQPIKVIEILDAQSVRETKDRTFLFDAGQNIAGWCSISLEGEPGDKIIMRHGEILDDNGNLYTENLGAAIQTDTIIIGQSGKLLYEPRFTYHGFRYVEVTGLRNKPDKNILKAKVIASDQPLTGSFRCSNPMLNQLVQNINRSHISNMHGIPTDCPQRDERCGWMGDVFIFAQTSMFNRDMAAFYNKWMYDITDAQSARGTFPDIAPHPFGYEKHFTNAPGWADAAVKLPYLMYVNYGDRQIIDKNFEAFERYIENIRRSNPDLIWRKGLGLNYGDWLNGNTLNAEGFPKTGAQIPSEVFSTIMFYNSVNLAGRMAVISGRNEKAEYYSEMASRIRNSFIKNFVDEEGKIEGDAQACYAMALHYSMFTDELEQKFEKRMIEKFIPYAGRMNTGFHSTLCLMKELVNRGYKDKAYELLETTEFPSWGYSIAQGATSIWERWDGYVKGRGFQGAGMNSFNHYAFGSVGEWMYENILGIHPDPENPAFRHFILKPVPGGTLTHAEGHYKSLNGLIKAGWKKENGIFEYEFSIPANTSATVSIPSRNIESVLLNGKKLTEITFINNIRFEDDYVSFEVNSGSYITTSEL